jgi:hypothetical protein
VIDDERDHPRVSVFIGIGDERVPADHLAVDDVVDRAAGRVRPLPGQDLVIVAMVGRVSAADIAFVRGLREEFAEGTLFLALGGRPIKPVLLVGLAYEVLGIDADDFARAILGRVFFLRVDVGLVDRVAEAADDRLKDGDHRP